MVNHVLLSLSSSLINSGFITFNRDCRATEDNLNPCCDAAALFRFIDMDPVPVDLWKAKEVLLERGGSAASFCGAGVVPPWNPSKDNTSTRRIVSTGGTSALLCTPHALSRLTGALELSTSMPDSENDVENMSSGNASSRTEAFADSFAKDTLAFIARSRRISARSSSNIRRCSSALMPLCVPTTASSPSSKSSDAFFFGAGSLLFVTLRLVPTFCKRGFSMWRIFCDCKCISAGGHVKSSPFRAARSCWIEYRCDSILIFKISSVQSNHADIRRKI